MGMVRKLFSNTFSILLSTKTYGMINNLWSFEPHYKDALNHLHVCLSDNRVNRFSALWMGFALFVMNVWSGAVIVSRRRDCVM